jgi:hypothetical protein
MLYYPQNVYQAVALGSWEIDPVVEIRGPWVIYLDILGNEAD